jgi:hypothetical protein
MNHDKLLAEKHSRQIRSTKHGQAFSAALKEFVEAFI